MAEQLFVAEGPKIVGELLHSDYTIQSVFAVEDWIISEQETLNARSVKYTLVTKEELERISQLTTPNLVLAVAEQKEYKVNADKINAAFSLVLDNISDPGNLGNIIRIADWFGIDDIYCSTDTVELYNPKVIQATMGSFMRVNVHYQNLTELLSHCANNISVYAANLDGIDIRTLEIPKNAIVIIGNESQGISKKLMKFVEKSISIPSFPHQNSALNNAESLNAAIATAIICAEFRKN